MDLYTFNPLNRQININGPNELGPFSIKVMCIVKNHFGSMEKFQAILDKASLENGIYKNGVPQLMSWLAYVLLIDDEYFPSECKFKSLFIEQRQEIYEYNVNTLLAIIRDSQPVINFKDLAGVAQKTNDSDIDLFSRSYAGIARETGFTIDQFYNLTLRQINQIQDDLNFIKNQEKEFLASMHGAKLQKPRDNRPNSQINFTKNENKTIDDFAKRRMEELKNERSHINT